MADEGNEAVERRIAGNGADAAESPNQSRARQFVRGCVGLAMLLSGAIFALPWILSQTVVGDTVMGVVADQLPEGTTFGRPLLNWTQPAGVSNVRFAGDEVDIHVVEARVSQPFWQLLLSPSKPRSLSVRGVKIDYRIPPVGVAEVPPNKGGDESKTAVDSLPALVCDAATIRVSGGPFRQPVLLSIDRATLSLPDADDQRTIEANGQVQVEGESETLAGSDFTLVYRGNLATKSGTASLKSESAQLQTLLASVVDPESIELTGTVASLIKVDREPDGPYRIKLGTTSDRLDVVVGGETTIPLPKANLATRLIYKPNEERVGLETLTFVSDAITASATGGWNLQPVGAAETNPSLIEANINGVGALLTAIGAPSEVSVPRFSMTGVRIARRERDNTPFATGTLSWPQAAAYSVVSSNGAADWTVGPEAITLAMTNVPVGTGRAVGTYRIDLGPQPTVSFGGGPVLDRVTLTETMCRDWLRYISPVLADSSEATGTISLQLDAFAMPLAGRPQTVKGVLAVHGAQVKAGPLADRLLGPLSAIRDPNARPIDLRNRPLATLPAQQVTFQVQPQAVSHDRFEARSGKLRVITTGSVSFDGQLAIDASIVPPAVDAAAKPLLAGLANQPFTVPVRGTIDKPTIERGAVREAGRDALRGAAAGALKRLLDR